VVLNLGLMHKYLQKEIEFLIAILEVYYKSYDIIKILCIFTKYLNQYLHHLSIKASF